MKIFNRISRKRSNFSVWTERIETVFVILALLAGIFSPWAVDTRKKELVFHAFFPREDNKFPFSEDREPIYTKKVRATAYSSDPRQTDSTPCRPAMDFNLCEYYEEYGVENTIAANFLPLGTQVKLPELFGDKIFIVRDRMNARYNGTNRIDIWVGSETPTSLEIVKEAKAKAISFGTKNVVMGVF